MSEALTERLERAVRNVGFHMSITKFSSTRWVIRRGKSTWWFTLPQEDKEFYAQIDALLEYARKLEEKR